MKTFILTLNLLFLYSLSFAQLSYDEVDTTVSVSVNGKILSDPFTGGYNTAQINEMDVNQDGIMDWIVYDRASGQVRPYINRGIPDSISYYYAPEYASAFPQLRDFLKTADYNDDGKMDLYDGSSNLQLWENTSTSANGLSFELEDKIQSLYNPNNTQKNTINPIRTNLPGIYDIDQDGDQDLFIFSQNGRSMDYHRSLDQEKNNNYALDYERRSYCWGSFLESGLSSSIELDTCILGQSSNGELRPHPDAFIRQMKDRLNTKSLKHAGSAISTIDIDNNGSMDILISDVDGYELKLLVNDDLSGRNSHIESVSDSFPNYDIPVDLLHPAAYFLDVNNDGFKDMIAASNVYNFSRNFPLGKDEIYYYENIANDGSYLFQFRQNDFLKEQTLDFGLNCHPIFFDYNKDGLQDLLIGNDGYVDSNLTDFKGQLALFENVGTSQSPKFKLIDFNYLDIPSLKLDLDNDTNSRNIIPTAGDIDGDGDEDLLIGERNGNVFLFEDTSATGQPAAFKFHPNGYQGINIRSRSVSNAPVLFDINKDGLLDVLVSADNPTINYFLNFGTATNPIFNIKVDSIIWQQDKTYRYYLKDTPNYSMLNINDTLSINNGTNLNNNTFVALILTDINETQNYLECINTLEGVIDDRYNETNTTAYINFFDRNWGNLSKATGYLGRPRLFPYREDGETKLVVGSAEGTTYFFDQIPDTVNPNDQFNLSMRDYTLHYGNNPFISGTDLNGDGQMDLAIGNEAGGLKLLYGGEPVGIHEINQNNNEGESLFTIYPNPTNDFVILRLKKQVRGSSELRIYDAKGRLISEQVVLENRLQINVKDLPRGMYFINLKNNNRISTSKLVITP